MQRIAVLALAGVSLWELGAMVAIFASVENPAYEISVCTAVPGGVVSDIGIPISSCRGLEALRQADVVAVPSASPSAAAPGLRAALSPGALAPGARVAAFGTAVPLLARLGLLHGRTVTATWPEAARLAAEFPAVKVDRRALFVDDGDILTAAGAGAVADLCLHLIRRDRGPAVANGIARRTLFPPRRQGGQSLYIPPEPPEPAEPVEPAEPPSGSTARTRTWARAHLAEPVSLPCLARHARMSIRTFTRHFRAETGTSPGNWLIRERVEYTRRLLETTDTPVEQLAPFVGFGSTESLRKHFRGALGVGPQNYRFMFGQHDRG